MNIPQQAIEKAIEGGWFTKLSKHNWKVEGYSLQIEEELGFFPFVHNKFRHLLRIESIALDPTFWQALGKALGWKRNAFVQWYDDFANKKEREAIRGVESWLFQARRFNDLILTGGDTEAYWNELLK